MRAHKAKTPDIDPIPLDNITQATGVSKVRDKLTMQISSFQAF